MTVRHLAAGLADPYAGTSPTLPLLLEPAEPRRSRCSQRRDLDFLRAARFSRGQEAGRCHSVYWTATGGDYCNRVNVENRAVDISPRLPFATGTCPRMANVSYAIRVRATTATTTTPIGPGCGTWVRSRCSASRGSQPSTPMDRSRRRTWAGVSQVRPHRVSTSVMQRPSQTCEGIRATVGNPVDRHRLGVDAVSATE